MATVATVPHLEVATIEQPVVVREGDPNVDGDGSGDDEGGMPGQPEGKEDLAPPPRDPTPKAERDDGGDTPFCHPREVLEGRICNEDRPTPSGFASGLRVSSPWHPPPCRKYKATHLRVEHEGGVAPVFSLAHGSREESFEPLLSIPLGTPA